jgi:hypothetical protein
MAINAGIGALIAADPAFQYYLPGRRNPASPIIILRLAAKIVEHAAVNPVAAGSLLEHIHGFAANFKTVAESHERVQKIRWKFLHERPLLGVPGGGGTSILSYVQAADTSGPEAGAIRQLADARMDLHNSIATIAESVDVDVVPLQIAVENEILKYYMGGGQGGAANAASLPVTNGLSNIWLVNEVSQLYLGHPVQQQTWPHHIT